MLLNNTYVDDCLFGASSIEETKQICHELITLMRHGSFELHKWCASHPDILTGIVDSTKLTQGIELNDTDFNVKALGLQLNIHSDQFIISRPCGHIFNSWTKRTVLSFIGTFFDPLGLAGQSSQKLRNSCKRSGYNV